MARLLVSATLAVEAGDGVDTDQGPCRHRQTLRRHTWAIVVANLNHVLRGWAAYFRYGNSASKFDDIDLYVHERLAILASRKHGLPGWNLGRFTWEWLTALKVYRLRGITRWGTPHAWR